LVVEAFPKTGKPPGADKNIQSSFFWQWIYDPIQGVRRRADDTGSALWDKNRTPEHRQADRSRDKPFFVSDIP
jgi:hypothetical protein